MRVTRARRGQGRASEARRAAGGASGRAARAGPGQRQDFPDSSTRPAGGPAARLITPRSVTEAPAARFLLRSRARLP